MKAERSPYSVHPSVAYVQAILANLEASSGLSAEGWVRQLKARGPVGQSRQRQWLKAQGLGTNQAALVVGQSQGGAENTFAHDEEDYLRAAARYVERQYSGAKAHLRPLYEVVLAAGLGAGPLAKACPCQTFVPLFHRHVFAQIKPSTSRRIDLGLALGDPKKVKDTSGRLVETGGFAKKDRITHRLELTRPADVDGTVRRWLKAAYARDG